MVKVKPLGKRVLIKRAKAVTTKGGIYLPDTAQEKPREGEVISVGPGKVDDQGRHDPVTLQVGDRILFSTYAGTEVKHPGQEDNAEYLIIAEDDVLGVLN
ncbi:MAG: co-chaperone GroES [Chlamydiales bacterium]|nr:co-chaperone GroES [Chlamydiales bacterium]